MMAKEKSTHRSVWPWVAAFVAVVAALVIAGWLTGVLKFGVPGEPADTGVGTASASPSARASVSSTVVPEPLPTGDRLALNEQIREALFTCGENLVPLSELTIDPVTFIYAASDAPPSVGRDQAVNNLCDRFLGGSNWADLSDEQFNNVQNGDYGQWTSNNALAVHDDAGDVILISLNEGNHIAVLLWGSAGTVAY